MLFIMLKKYNTMTKIYEKVAENFLELASLQRLNILFKLLERNRKRIEPLAKELVFMCPEGHRTDVILDKDLKLTTPLQCSNSKCSHKELGIEPKSSRFIDVQFVRLQELPEDLPPGQLPHYLDVTVKQDLVDDARPGDRIVLTGIIRIEQERMSGVSKNESPLYRLRLDGNNVEFLGSKKDKSYRKIQREEISQEDEKMIK